jgi:hypothetical protein
MKSLYQHMPVVTFNQIIGKWEACANSSGGI